MKMKKLIRTICFIAFAGYGLAFAQSRDPFTPYAVSPPVAASVGKAVDPAEGNNPLTDKPITAYTVIGVAISPTDAMAVLKSRDKHEYFAYIGDEVGSEGGKIETISSEGITVNINGKIVNLKVSNRLEIKDDKQIDEAK